MLVLKLTSDLLCHYNFYHKTGWVIKHVEIQDNIGSQSFIVKGHFTLKWNACTVELTSG